MRLLPIVVLVAMLGCKSIKPADVTGTWVITDQSRQSLPSDLQKALAKIVVNADGSFVASELPEELQPTPPYDMKARVRLDSGSGVWKLASWEGSEHLQLEFRMLTSGNENRHVSYGFPLTVSSRWSVVTVHYFLGDPDESRRIEFERK